MTAFSLLKKKWYSSQRHCSTDLDRTLDVIREMSTQFYNKLFFVSALFLFWGKGPKLVAVIFNFCEVNYILSKGKKKQQQDLQHFLLFIDLELRYNAHLLHNTVGISASSKTHVQFQWYWDIWPLDNVKALTALPSRMHQYFYGKTPMLMLAFFFLLLRDFFHQESQHQIWASYTGLLTLHNCESIHFCPL